MSVLLSYFAATVTGGCGGLVLALAFLRSKEAKRHDANDAVWQFAAEYARPSGDGPTCSCVPCRAFRAVQGSPVVASVGEDPE